MNDNEEKNFELDPEIIERDINLLFKKCPKCDYKFTSEDKFVFNQKTNYEQQLFCEKCDFLIEIHIDRKKQATLLSQYTITFEDEGQPVFYSYYNNQFHKDLIIGDAGITDWFGLDSQAGAVKFVSTNRTGGLLSAEEGISFYKFKESENKTEDFFYDIYNKDFPEVARFLPDYGFLNMANSKCILLNKKKKIFLFATLDKNLDIGKVYYEFNFNKPVLFLNHPKKPLLYLLREGDYLTQFSWESEEMEILDFFKINNLLTAIYNPMTDDFLIFQSDGVLNIDCDNKKVNSIQLDTTPYAQFSDDGTHLALLYWEKNILEIYQWPSLEMRSIDITKITQEFGIDPPKFHYYLGSFISPFQWLCSENVIFLCIGNSILLVYDFDKDRWISVPYIANLSHIYFITPKKFILKHINAYYDSLFIEDEEYEEYEDKEDEDSADDEDDG